MDSLRVEVHGLREIEQALREFSSEDSIAGAKVIRSAMMSASLPMYRTMQATAPVSQDPKPRKRRSKRGGTVEIRPGFLKFKVRRRSYINKTGYGNRNISGNGLVKVRLGAFTPYAHLVELGTEHSPAQPFVKPAFDSHWRGTLNRFGGLLEKRLASARRRRAST